MACAIENPYKNPEQEAETSKAPTGLQPNPRCTKQAVEGNTMSGDVVESTIASIAEASQPAASSARRPAAIARSDAASCAPAQWRD